ncbi:hypothetical protein DJ013_11550 [Arcticibacterium luteifluviistationis]|uniref:HTH cro/C1-type domain-containing protein n=2 Tax=Arcticibacterium luteifluviistationis TaxID=1784714 RepID=A0A2Z4GCA6_9BACT|nr:hypothetical protein DJ013_11550 [Arcticibacterium luteifluviistationis]
MKQPDLGKKILELRLAKGLTQSELADECNVSLRTVQRIEAAEVMPRSYTIKLIFDNLDFDFFNTDKAPTKSETLKETTQNRLASFSEKFDNTFNLKTKEMKAIVYVTVLCLALAALFFGIAEFRNSGINRVDQASSSDINPNFVRWFNAGQMDSLGSVYLPDAYIMPIDHERIKGRQDIINYYQDLYDMGFRLTSNIPEEILKSDSIAVERGVWTGFNNGEFSGNYLTQWRLVQGHWYIENSMSSAN